MPKTRNDSQDEPASPGSKMSAEYTLDERKVIDDKNSNKMSNKSPTKQPPPKASGKNVTCNVFLLDGENVEFIIDKNDNGRALFDKVCTHLDLIERDYFGMTYTDDRGPTHLKYWLNLDKKIARQKKRGAWVFEFALKFYPPDPSQLRESLTRWLVVLQVRRDLLSGRIPCTFTTYALLGSYNVQADIGEYDPADHGHAYDYIKDMTFAPNQTPELLEKIAELHKLHKGQTPDEAEKGFLDNAKKLAMYGVDLHKAKDSDNNAVMVGVCCSGLLIFRDKLRLNRFVWPKILKLSYKRNHFYIKIRPGEMERHETTVMFKLDNHKLAKRLWKTCVEHHAFFRLREADKPTNNVTFPRFGSKFRYSGRTLYQTRQNAALLDRPPPFFERSQPARNTVPDRSRSVDELGRNKKAGPYEDGMYGPDRGSKEYPNKYGDEKDRKDVKGVLPAYAQVGKGGDGRGAGDEDTLQRRPPYDSYTADRKDRLPSQGRYDPATETAFGVGSGSAALEGGREEKFNPYGPPYGKDGFNEHGYDKDGYDKDGYDKDGFDKDGFDRKGNKTPYGPPYGKDGFNENGYDKDGYDRDGYDKDGYDRKDYDIKGRKKPYAGPYGKDGYNKNNYKKDGYDRDGYDKNAFDKKGNNKRGQKNPYGPPFGKDGFNDNGYNKHGLDKDGRDKDGYDKKDLDKYGRKNPYAPPYDKDGYNENGFDKHGFDRDGYDKDGFDKDGYDRKGNKTPYGPPFGKDGFNENGYDKDGYDRDGYDKDGYDRKDYDIKGRKKPYAGPYGKDGYNDNGYKKDGYDRDGYDKNAFDKKGNNKRGQKNPYGPPFGKDGFNDNGYNKHGLDRDGRDKDGYDKNDLDKFGRKNPYAPPYDKDGYNENGFDKHGFDRNGYDKDGFNKDGYDRNGKQNPYGPPYGKDGYNKNGFDKNGFDRDGYDKDGYDRDGYDRNRKKNPYGPPYGKDGYNKNGYDKDGFDKHGYDKDGYDRKGFDKDGYNRDGKDKHGKPRKDKKGVGILGKLKKVGKDSDAEESPRGKDTDKNNLLGSGFPYGVGLGVGKGDMTGVVGEEKSVDNKLRFIPTPKPHKETKESLKPEGTMPFFHPAATSTVGRPKVPPPVLPKGSQGLDDSFNPPTIATETVKYNPTILDVPMSSRNIPLVKTEVRTVMYELGNSPFGRDDDTLISAQSQGSRLQTIETISLKAKRGVYSGDEEDDYDFDAALTDAIRCVTEFNPDMSVERIECVQQIEDVKSGK